MVRSGILFSPSSVKLIKLNEYLSMSTLDYDQVSIDGELYRVLSIGPSGITFFDGIVTECLVAADRGSQLHEGHENRWILPENLSAVIEDEYIRWPIPYLDQHGLFPNEWAANMAVLDVVQALYETRASER